VTTTFVYAAGAYSATGAKNSTGVLSWEAISSNGGNYADRWTEDAPSRGIVAITGLTAGKTYTIGPWLPIPTGWAALSSPSRPFTPLC